MWTNRWMDRQTDKKRTNKQTEFHQFRKVPSYDGDLSPCLPPGLNSIGQTIFELESGNENVDKQMDGRQTEEKRTNKRTNRQKTDKRTDGISPISKV